MRDLGTFLRLGSYKAGVAWRPKPQSGARDAHPAAKPFKAALLADGIPFTSFGVKDVGAEHERLVGLGVRFTQPPVAMGPVTTAVFDDTCGNLIQIAQRH